MHSSLHLRFGKNSTSKVNYIFPTRVQKVVKPITTQNFDEVRCWNMVYRLHLANLDLTLWTINFRILTIDLFFWVQDHSLFVMKKLDNGCCTQRKLVLLMEGSIHFPPLIFIHIPCIHWWTTDQVAPKFQTQCLSLSAFPHKLTRLTPWPPKKGTKALF